MKKQHQTGMKIGCKEKTMKDLAKKSVMAACSLAFLGLAAGQAQALTVSIYSVDTQQTEIDNWIAGLGGGTTIIEDFDSSTVGWYGGDGTGLGVVDATLNTAVGEFTAGGLAGTGSSSYNGVNSTDDPNPYFELRDDATHGRFDGTRYLDSADITELTLDVAPGFTNLFMYVKDPGDIWGNTTTSVDPGGVPATIDYPQANGSLWFVGIDGEGENIATINWTVANHVDGTTPYTNDGFGIDNIGHVVPEPSTALLLGAGLLPLVGLRRRKKK